jgi:hypothetical protein
MIGAKTSGLARAEATNRSISRVANEALWLALAEDAEYLKAFQSRAHEPNLDFDNMGPVYQ